MDNIDLLKKLFEKFPGVGPRQAERFTYFVLRSSNQYKKELSSAILNISKNTAKCVKCHRYFLKKSDNDNYCKICADKSRDTKLLMLLEKESDIDKMEKISEYKGNYFVTGGNVSPLNDSDKHKKYLKNIKGAINNSELKEIILAFSTTFDGEYTARFLKEELSKSYPEIKISMLAKGMSSGSEIEYADSETIREALKNRH